MQLRQRLLTSLVPLLILLVPAYGYHLDGKPGGGLKEQVKRQVRAVEAAPIQPQQDQGVSQDQYGRSRETDLLDDPLRFTADGIRQGRLLSVYPAESRGYYLPYHSGAGRWLAGAPAELPRTVRADSNFIRFGRSAFPGSSGFRSGSKKNNFIRLGRENPRQNNFIRLGRSGSWDSYERPLPKVGFFPDYFPSTPSGYHWSRPADLTFNDLNSSDDTSN